MDKSQYQRIWLRALNLYELQLAGPVARNRNKFIAQAASEYQKHQTIPQHVRYAYEIRLQNILIQHYGADNTPLGTPCLSAGCNRNLPILTRISWSLSLGVPPELPPVTCEYAVNRGTPVRRNTGW
jgi:hypothetical protein